VTAATEETSQAEEVTEAVPSSVVVDLVDAKVAFKQRSNKYKGRNQTVPEAKPETRDYVVFTRRTSGWIRSRSTSNQNIQQQ
jgi:hypothetical protein